MNFPLRRTALAAGLALSGAPALAVPLEVAVTNHSAADGLFLTPLLAVFHDGGYAPFERGAEASPGLELLAEQGDPSGQLAGDAAGFQAAVITAPGGFAGAPVLDPGETARLVVDVDPATALYFSFLSMVIPSTDSFIGNGDPFAIPLFDAAGAFLSPARFEVYGGDVWDAGTELDQPGGVGAAFSTAGGEAPDEGGTVQRESSLDILLGVQTAAGTTIGSVPGLGDLFVSIEITQLSDVPVPAALPLAAAALGALGLVGARRRG
ncbi:spondin domain-containing protein [Rhodovulum sp. DZ06]|uniref:spondin domain-containing protein n=1 Tax=Rhodovulum sp. DZ06 TaxID=3425126 RepID=UPI003D349E5D